MLSSVKKLSGSKENFSSKEYWEKRYKDAGNSGSGSYGHLAAFKADVLNDLFNKYDLSGIIEFGCGDGNQLSMLKCKHYIGLDVSVTALDRCISTYSQDKTKSFFLYDYRAFADNEGIFKMDCSLSLDVLYHLVEEKVYLSYLRNLFGSAKKMVVIYAANVDIEQKTTHELFRQFTKDVEKHITGWKLTDTIKNKYPSKDYEDQEGSLSDFFVYQPVA
jgi:hypothetical protein